MSLITRILSLKDIQLIKSNIEMVASNNDAFDIVVTSLTKILERFGKNLSEKSIFDEINQFRKMFEEDHINILVAVVCKATTEQLPINILRSSKKSFVTLTGQQSTAILVSLHECLLDDALELKDFVAFKCGIISPKDILDKMGRYKLERDMYHSHESQHTDLMVAYKKEQLENDLSFGDIDVHTYHSRMLDYDCELEISKSPKNEEEIKQLYVLKKLENDYECEKISKRDYEKQRATLEKKIWYNFSVALDIENNDPDIWEFDIDYNNYFVEWLLNNGHELPKGFLEQLKLDLESGKEEFDTFDDAVEHYTIEFWFKNNMTKIVAGFLRSESGETFRSVLADDPAATIVEELQIDESVISESEDESFKEFAKAIKKRKSYR